MEKWRFGCSIAPFLHGIANCNTPNLQFAVANLQSQRTTERTRKEGIDPILRRSTMRALSDTLRGQSPAILTQEVQMENHTERRSRPLLLAVAAGFALGFLPGCATNGYQKGDIAAVGMQRAATEVQAESRAIDQTAAYLRDLVSETNGDL